MATEEIEVNFRLDGDGRTTSTKDTNKEVCSPSTIDYQSKTTSSRFVVPSESSSSQLDSDALLDELLYDCEIADSGLMSRTFWLPATGFTPRCSLEQMALDVFQYRVKDTNYDPETSGAEWWVQLRPSPEKTGRYSMHDDTSNDKDMSKQGISFHWDKDEDLRLLCGGNTYVHPHLSTVTYLTDLGAPTLALNCRIHNFSGEWIVPGNEQEAFISWPKKGKHLSFDGRYLHAAPSDLMEDGQFETQCQFEAKNEKERRVLQRRHRRITFLVNIWLNYHPFDVKPFPDTMIDKMSGNKDDRVQLALDKEPDSARTVTVHNGVLAEGISDAENKLQYFEWPMGDCGSGECIKISIPLNVAREQAEGQNLKIRWQLGSDSSEVGIRLCHNEKTIEPDTKRARLEGSSS